jgi:hypothetical protein
VVLSVGTSSSNPLMEGLMCRFRRKLEPASDINAAAADGLKALSINSNALNFGMSGGRSSKTSTV